MRDKINDPARIDLMLDAIANIEQFILGTSDCETFASNKILCHAVIYNLQCIGECVYKLSREFIASHPLVDWESIEGLRHVLVHDYYSVDLKTVWTILEGDLAELKDYLFRIRNASC